MVDLPLVPVIATNGDRGATRRALAAEQLDVADDLEAGRLGAFDGPMRFRMRQRHAGRQHEELRTSTSRADARSTGAKPAADAFARARFAVVPGGDLAPPATSARNVDRPEPPEPEQRDAPTR